MWPAISSLFHMFTWVNCTCVCAVQGAPEGGEVLYEDPVLYFDDTRKWRERYVVVRANYCLECHDGLEVSVTVKCQKCPMDLLAPAPSDPFLLTLCSLSIPFTRALSKGFLPVRICCLQGAPSWPRRRSTWSWWTSASPMTPVSKRYLIPLWEIKEYRASTSAQMEKCN